MKKDKGSGCCNIHMLYCCMLYYFLLYLLKVTYELLILSVKKFEHINYDDALVTHTQRQVSRVHTRSSLSVLCRLGSYLQDTKIRNLIGTLFSLVDAFPFSVALPVFYCNNSDLKQVLYSPVSHSSIEDVLWNNICRCITMKNCYIPYFSKRIAFLNSK